MKLIILLATLAIAKAGVAQDLAYAFRGDAVHVDESSHWRNWVYQNNLVRDLSSPIDSTGLFEFTTEGIKPIFFPGRRNYVLDAAEFTYIVRLPGHSPDPIPGGSTALSNAASARNVGDGDPATSWEPADEDFNESGLRNWQVQVDLGRVVWADSIVVIFPPLESGGEMDLPLIPEGLTSLAQLPVELETQIEVLARRSSLYEVQSTETLVGAEGDTLVRQGDVLLSAGQRLPRDLSTLRLLRALGIVSVEVEGGRDLGDVPKLFVIEVSMGKQAGDTSSKNYYYDIIGRGEAATNQRRFVFPLEPLDKADFDLDGFPDFPGTFVHIVRLTIYDSDLDQKEFLGDGEIGRLAYEEIAPERRGQRTFQRVTAGGFTKRLTDVVGEDGSVVVDGDGVLLTAENIYTQKLTESEQGPIRYFKRELPRVAEIEVWGQGPNLAYRPERHAGGGFEDGGWGTPLDATDGVYLTRWMGNAWDIKYSTGGGGQDALICCTSWLDLGAVFWVDKIFTGAVTTVQNSSEGAVFGLHLLGSDGTALRPLNMQTVDDFTQLEFGLAWTDMVAEIHKNNWANRNRIIRETFPKRKLRFFQVRNDDPTGQVSGSYSAQGHFNEIQLYGEGYPAEVSVTSPPIVLLPGITSVEQAATVRQRRALAEIHWEAEAVVRRIDPFTGQNIEVAEPLDMHPEVRVEVQTRTSDTIDSLFTYYEVSGMGTSTESRKEVDVGRFYELQDLWAEFDAWDSLPAERKVRLQKHRTGRDDDGDGATDEDPIDGLDNDGDNLIDEDALTGDLGGPNSRGNITLLKHKRKQDDDGDGATDEDPIDGVDNDGDFLIDEDGKKKSKPRQAGDETATPYFGGWSAWSEPYQAMPDGSTRALITSPNPRKFFQMRVNILSDDPDLTARIRSMRVDLAAPITTEAVGELAILTDAGVLREVQELTPLATDYAPPQNIEPLAQQPFSYFLRAAAPDPEYRDDPAVAEGFDQVLLNTPSEATLTGVRQGRVHVVDRDDVSEVVETRFQQAFVPQAGAANVLVDGSGVQLPFQSRGDSLLIQFPAPLNKELEAGEHAIVELQFTTQTLNAGTEFLAFVSSSSLEDAVFQRVESEGRDATELVNSATARPTILHSDKVIDEIQIPSVFTPNGDGLNDALDVSFTVLRLRADRPMSVAFYDLSGRLMGQAAPETGADTGRSGTVRYRWDARDGSGTMVPPGMYLAHIVVETDDSDVNVTRLVHVAY